MNVPACDPPRGATYGVGVDGVNEGVGVGVIGDNPEPVSTDIASTSIVEGVGIAFWMILFVI